MLYLSPRNYGTFMTSYVMLRVSTLIVVGIWAKRLSALIFAFLRKSCHNRSTNSRAGKTLLHCQWTPFFSKLYSDFLSPFSHFFPFWTNTSVLLSSGLINWLPCLLYFDFGTFFFPKKSIAILKISFKNQVRKLLDLIQTFMDRILLGHTQGDDLFYETLLGMIVNFSDVNSGQARNVACRVCGWYKIIERQSK